MTQTTAGFADLPAFDRSAAKAAAPSRVRSVLRRAADAIRRQRERRAEAAVARFIRRNGGTLTDELERRIAREYAYLVGDR